MKDRDTLDLSPEDKKLMNLLEIKLYDISQNVEILGKQLTNNQIKDIISMSYSIFNQLKTISQKTGVISLYNLHKKMQVNSIHICSLLTDRLDRQPKITELPCKCHLDSTQAQPSKQDSAPIETDQQQLRRPNIPRLGGIHIYNDSHTRGLEFLENKVGEGGLGAKKRMVRECKQEFITAVMNELEDRAEVEVDSINDEVKNYISNFKENSRAFSLFSCETELMEIIDFFKMSELEAINFLNKSPNNNHEYTQDYLNRISDLQIDIKKKEKSEKGSMLDKMKQFVEKLKLQVAEVQRIYQEKNARLLELQKSLRKVTSSVGTQTYDGFQRRIKQLQQQLREQEQKCQILNQMRKEEHNYEDQIHNLNQLLQMKINEIKKIKTAKIDLEEELAALKKVVRDNNERMTSKVELERKKNKVKQMLMEPFAQEKNEAQNQAMQVSPRVSINRDHFQERKSRKYERTINNSSQSYRTSMEVEKIKMLATAKGQYELSRDSNEREGDNIYGSQNPNEFRREQEIRQSGFKAEFKKTNNNNTQLKKISEEERQVSFKMCQEARGTEKILRLPQGAEEVNWSKGQKSRSMVSIEQEDVFRKNSRKNTLRQRIDPIASSMRDLEEDEPKKSSKSVSKRCIILKETKQKNIITTMLKIDNFFINPQYTLVIEPTLQRPSRNTANDYRTRNTRPSFYNSSSSLKPSQIGKEALNTTTSKKEILRKKDPPKESQPFRSRNPDGGVLPVKQAVDEYQSREDDRSAAYSNLRSQKKQVGTKKKKMQDRGKEAQIEGDFSMELASQQRLERINKATSIKKCKPEADSRPIDTNIPNSSLLKNLNKNVSNKGKKGELSSNSQSHWRSDELLGLGSEELDLIRSIRMDGQQHQARGENPLIDNRAQIQALTQLFQHENLDIQEFQQMIKIITYGHPLQDSTLTKQLVSAMDLSAKPEPRHFRNLENRNCSKQAAVNKQLEKGSKQMEEEQPFTKYRKDSLSLHGQLIESIKQVHAHFGRCSEMTAANRHCAHIQKYIHIITKINAAPFKSRVVLKLPIEKIGQNSQQLIREQSGECQNQRTIKKGSALGWKDRQPCQRRENLEGGSCFNNTSGENEDRTRMLPIISQTISNYYKAKSKVGK